MKHHKWSARSLASIDSCVWQLQDIAHLTLQRSPFDVTAPDGHRNEHDQNYAYASGRTRPGPIVTNVQWPNGNHNDIPSRALHLEPYPIDYKDTAKYLVLIGVVWSAVVDLGWLELVRNGRDWDHDFDFRDQKKLLDFAHWEWLGEIIERS